MQAETLQGGFSDAPRDAAAAFRAVMEALARPGTIQHLAGVTPPLPLSPAAGAVLLTLCDIDTPVHLAGAADCDAVRGWLAFHTGAPVTGPAHAMFAVGTWEALLPLAHYPVGTADYPDRSATLIVEMPVLEAQGTVLTGPGIRETAALSLPDADMLAANHARFPLGLDFLFTCGDRVAGLPRSTAIAAKETV